MQTRSKLNILLTSLMLFLSLQLLLAQNIHDFVSLDASSINHLTKGDTLRLPDTHTYQVLMQDGDFNTGSRYNSDFAGYVPINNSSTEGYLSINSEIKVGSSCDATLQGGGVLMLDIEFDNNQKIWDVLNSTKINFDAYDGTSKNCSGAITPWGTVISSEEHGNSSLECQGYQSNGSGYYKYGWQIEIDPVNKQVLGKHYAMGRFKHENAAIHPNRRTIYQGADDDSDGYLYKFVAHTADDLSAGDLYVYKDDDDSTTFVNNNEVKIEGQGAWIKIPNTTVSERNNTKQLATAAGATKFKKLEDIEISPDGKVFLAAAEEDVVYYLEDLEPIPADVNSPSPVNFLGVYAGGVFYDITRSDGSTYPEEWTIGNDNLAFDNDGNLWVMQDGGKYHIWVVRNGHTQDSPKVEIFAITPKDSEPTGITFSPDNKFMFLSLQINNAFGTRSIQLDAAENPIQFDKSTTLVIARKEFLGPQSCELNIVHAHGSPVSEETYQAQQSISSQACLNNQDVEYYAGDRITLGSGFEIGIGVEFSAEIRTCNP